jgi:hypothetical protein
MLDGGRRLRVLANVGRLRDVEPSGPVRTSDGVNA